jgi:hypothetical protein
MRDEAIKRILDYDRRRYWLENGWSLRFRIRETAVTDERPHGLKYALTLHDTDGARLLGFDNAHGVRRVEAYDHGHRFRKAEELVPYAFLDADTLLCDFFDAVERACEAEGLAFDLVEEDLELEDGDEAQEPD